MRTIPTLAITIPLVVATTTATTATAKRMSYFLTNVVHDWLIKLIG